MDLSADKKSTIMLDLLHELLGEMKMGAGSKLKPKEEVVVEAEPEMKPEGSLEEHLDKVSEEGPDEEDLAGLMDDEEDEDCEPKTAAGSRLDRLLKK